MQDLYNKYLGTRKASEPKKIMLPPNAAPTPEYTSSNGTYKQKQ